MESVKYSSSSVDASNRCARACRLGRQTSRERVYVMHQKQRANILLQVANSRQQVINNNCNCVISAQAKQVKMQKMFILSRRRPKIVFLSLLLSSIVTHLCNLLLLLTIGALLAQAAQQNITSPSNSSTLPTTTRPKTQDEPHDQFKLDCQPGEQRQFSYESSTKVWGSSDQQVRLRAILRLKCMEPPTNTTLKYLAEIITVKPNFIYDQSQESQSSSSSKLQQQQQPKPKVAAMARNINRQSQFSTIEEYARRQQKLRQQQATGAGRGQQSHTDHLRIPNEAEVDQMLRAEPLLEEVGEVASRMKRSVSGWFSKAWVSVKDFFGNIFTSSERSSVSRDQVFKESGLDIAGQCKASSSHKGKGAAGLPFDESVFEDLGPEYYVGASLDGTQGLEFLAAGHVSTFGPGRDNQPGEDEDAELMSLSFFDDPPTLRRATDKARAKRATLAATSQEKSSRTGKAVVVESGDHERLLKVPFVFIQSRSGKIVEIRFSGEEKDLSVKNFKRHLCDLFATNLDWNKTTQNEVSPIGKHQTKYTLDASANSMDSMKRTMLDNSGSLPSGQSDYEERTNKQQLVRVLATLGTSDRRFLSVNNNNNNNTKPLVATGGGLRNDDDEENGEGHFGDNESPPRSLSVLRSINTTGSIQQMGSKVVLAPEIDRMQVRVKQVQQINEGRLVGTAGQLSMSLVVAQMQQGDKRAKRDKRQARADPEQVEDISDLLKVSTSFSMQLVPLPRNPDGSVAQENEEEEEEAAAGEESAPRSQRTRRSTEDDKSKEKKQAKRRATARSAVKLAPSDAQELQRVLQDWRKQEARLQLSSANLVSENQSGLQESQTTRLDILRDQIRQRLNEEFVRNRIRRSLSMQQVALAAAASSVRSSDAIQQENKLSEQRERPAATVLPPGGDLGLGLTQLVLGTGVTTRRKGSIYATLEEALELEAQLMDDRSELAVSKLMRDTLKMDKLRQHCRASIPSLRELTLGDSATTSSNLEIERRLPFGLKDDPSSEGASRDLRGEGSEIRDRARRRARQVEQLARRNDRKLEQCQQMLRLVLKLNNRQAVDLVLELIDECNSRLVAAAKQEELGYGPVSKYFRRQRQHFLELLVHVGRPTDSLLDKLILRLYHYPKLAGSSVAALASSSKTPLTGVTTKAKVEPEFVYLTKAERDSGQVTSTGSDGGGKSFNKSLLREEDDFNNNDGAGLLVMTLTSLAAKSSIGRLKRLEVAEKLLGSLKGTTCSLFSSPDLDILESMANFQEPLDEIVGRILQLARKCKQHDQYVVACVHGLSGQLHHAGTQRLFGDLLKSQNVSCTIKSEVVLTLIGAQLINDLRHEQPSPVRNASQLVEPPAGWPSGGANLNKLDEILLELVDSRDKLREPDRRCLRHLVAHYLSKRQQVAGTSSTRKPVAATPRRAERRSFRHKRAVPNEQGFWDDAQCKRWSMPADGSPFGSADSALTHLYSEGAADHPSTGAPPSSNSSITDLIDEIDDNSILSAIINHNQQRQARTSSSSSRRRQQKLIERELTDLGGPNATSAGLQTQAGQNNNSQQVLLRRRHKCVASKDFGPKNAQATLKAEIVNDLVGAKDENKFLARFRLATNFLGNHIDVGRMYLWHQRRTTRAYANILGRSIWDSSHGCKDKAPSQVLYMPLFDFSLWLVKISVGVRLNAEMGFFPNCDQPPEVVHSQGGVAANSTPEQTSRQTRYTSMDGGASDELQLFPTITLRAAGEATAKLVVARAGMSLASQYSYQGDIRVSRQPESCMSIYSAHQPMNITFSSWFQLWDNDCHFWGSRNRAEPQATKWRLTGQKPIAWLENECLASTGSRQTPQDNSTSAAAATTSARLIPLNQINP